jgi:Protein of unknown function (DUF1552)
VISYKFARRSFLRGMGAGSAALMLPLLRSIEARAAGAAAPLRFLIIHHPLGTAPGLANWRPNASATTTNFTLPIESAPFTPLQKYMVMVDGVNSVSATSGKDSTGNHGGQNTHEGGMVALMTGVPTLGSVGQQDHCAGGPSIDQIFLQKSPVLGGSNFGSPTPFQSLQLAADVRSDRDEKAPRVLSYLAPKSGVSDPDQARQPLFPDTSPLNVFNRIFGGALPSGMNGAQVLAQKESVITYLKGDLARMQTLVPASEKDRLTAHAEAINELEKSLQAMYGMTSTQNGVCAKPTAPMNFSNTSSGKQGSGTVYSDLGGVDYYVPNSSTSHPHVDLGQAQLRLIKAAFLCDLCRVSTFMWSAGTNWVVFPGTFQGATIAGNPQSSPHHPPSHAGDSATNAWLNQVDQFYSQATSTVLQEYATTPDIDGNMLIDNTVIVYFTEVARAYDHNQQNIPLLIFGGKNTKVKGGTYLKVTDGSLGTQTGGTGNRPFNDVWLALAPVFGVTMSSLGDKTQYTGPLPGIVST